MLKKQMKTAAKAFNNLRQYTLLTDFWGSMLTGIFGTGAPIQTDINLIMQIIMVIIIFISLVYKNRLEFKMHGILMALAVVLHIISLVAVMGPSFAQAYDYFTTATSEFAVQTTWIHAIPGVIAMILGIFLIVGWALRPANLAACSRNKRLMDLTVLLWVVSLVFGIVSYVAFYT
jgi:uncharacterized membrane protein YozB (DUF420 family)